LFNTRKWWVAEEVERFSARLGETKVLWNAKIPLGSWGGTVPNA
jgi:hypothetical protein